MTARSLDHGELNIPLAKRGDIDAQIDRYLKAEAGERRKAHRAGLARQRANQAEAKALVAQIPEARLAEIGRALGLTVAKTRKALLLKASAKPAVMLPILRREAAGG